MRNELERSLLRARYEVPFYINYFRNIKKQNLKLSDFPIVTKKEYANNYDLFCSNKYRTINFNVFPTSGSTGIPLEILKTTKEELLQNIVMWKFRYKHFGITTSMKSIVFHFDTDNIEKNNIIIENNELSINIYALNKDFIKNNHQIIEDFNPQYIRGIPSAICDFILIYKELKYPMLKIKYVESSGEYLFDYQRKLIKDAFKCSISNQYGCTEIWGIAQECEFGHMHILEGNVKLEIEKNKENNFGEIIITGLNSYYTSFVRYKTGDIGKLENTKCKCGEKGQELTVIGGRVVDYILLENGKKEHPIIFYKIIREISLNQNQILKFKVIQNTTNNFIVYVTLKNASQKNKNEFIDLFDKLIKKSILRNSCFNFIFLGFNDYPVLRKKHSYFEKLL